MWEGGHRVPAIAWWPRKIKPGAVVDDLSISLDLMPTMLELAGVHPPEGHKLDGLSLVSLLSDNQRLGKRQLCWNGKAMRGGQWKLIIDDKAAKLYNLAEDIGEQKDLAEQHAEIAQDMLAAIRNWEKNIATDTTQ